MPSSTRPTAGSPAVGAWTAPSTAAAGLVSWKKRSGATPQGCPTGDAVVTEAGNLPARYVIHAVGPIWKGGHNQEESLLASAYRRSLEVAGARQCASVAFPSLSTGAYAYPLTQAAHVALRTVAAYLRQHGRPEEVRFVLFDDRTYEAYAAVLADLLKENRCQ